VSSSCHDAAEAPARHPTLGLSGRRDGRTVGVVDSRAGRRHAWSRCRARADQRSGERGWEVGGAIIGNTANPSTLPNAARSRWQYCVLQEIPGKVVADTTDTALTPLMDSSAARSPCTESAGGFLFKCLGKFPRVSEASRLIQTIQAVTGARSSPPVSGFSGRCGQPFRKHSSCERRHFSRQLGLFRCHW
jgi:hypothetical protein